MKVGDLVRGNTKRKNPFQVQVDSTAIITDIDEQGWITIFWLTGPAARMRGESTNFRKIELEVINEGW